MKRNEGRQKRVRKAGKMEELPVEKGGRTGDRGTTRDAREWDEEGGTRKDRETSAEGGDESERVNQQETKEREGGGSITDGPGVVTLKRVNGQEPNFPPTRFFSLHHQHLSLSPQSFPSFPPPPPPHSPAFSLPPS